MSDLGSGGEQIPVYIPDMLAAATPYNIVGGNPGGGSDSGGGADDPLYEYRMIRKLDGSLTIDQVDVLEKNGNHNWTITFDASDRNRGPVRIVADSGEAISLHNGDESEDNYFELSSSGTGNSDRITITRLQARGDHAGDFRLQCAKGGKYLCADPALKTQSTAIRQKAGHDNGSYIVRWYFRKV